MNILVDKLPEYIEVCGNKYPINTDFRVWIGFEELFFTEGTPVEKIAAAIRLCMSQKSGKKLVLPPSLTETVEQLCKFYFCSDCKNAVEKRASGDAVRLYSFSLDAELIYAAFLQQYNIDLTLCNMHWWRFRALFSGIFSDTKLSAVMKIRAADLSEVSGSARGRLARLKAVYAIPDFKSSEQRENELAEAFW